MKFWILIVRGWITFNKAIFVRNENYELVSSWYLKLTFCFMATTYEILHLNEQSFVQWKIVDIHTSFLLLPELLTKFSNLVFVNSLPRTDLSISFWDDLYFASLLAGIYGLILEISHLASFPRILSSSSGMFEFLLLFFVLSIVLLYQHFFGGLILYILVMAWRMSSVLLSDVVYLLFSTHFSLPYLRAAFAVVYA
jgi:hypothetical protein